VIEIAVAGVAALIAVLAALVERGGRQNSREHGMVIEHMSSMERNLSSRMDRTDDHIDRLAEKVDGHIDWHLDQKQPRKSSAAAKKTSSRKPTRRKMTG